MKKIYGVYKASFHGLSHASWLLSIVMLINRAGSMVLPFLGIYMVDRLGFSIIESGIVLSCFGIGSLLGSWLGGYLTDKIGDYSVQVFSLFVSVPLFCLYPFYSTPLAIGMIVFVQSVISTLFMPANSVAISKYALPGNLTRSFSLNRMAINLGFSIGPAMGGFLSAVSYDLLFFGNALMALLAGLAFVLFFRKGHKVEKLEKIKTKQEKQAKKVIKELSPYKDFPFLIFTLICMGFAIGFFQLMSTLPIFYKEDLRMAQSMIGLLMATNGLTVFILEMPLVNFSETRLTIPQTMFWGSMFSAVSFLIIAFNPAYWMLFLGMILLSIGEILILPFMSSITAQRSGENNKGAYMGLNNLSISVAFVVTPLLGTQLISIIGFSNLWMATFFLFSTCAVAFYYFTPKLRKPKKMVAY
ncbi:MAG TPA: MFS transporter [Edaphocola sp.]|nr:MFS transporter [Edaphocola sp.]